MNNKFLIGNDLLDDVAKGHDSHQLIIFWFIFFSVKPKPVRLFRILVPIYSNPIMFARVYYFELDIQQNNLIQIINLNDIFPA